MNVAAPIDPAHADRMDRMYRYTRHVYDMSRRFYLLGRDRLLRGATLEPRSCVLEMGCGTARNLIKLARLHPTPAFFGLDASHSMLQTAQARLQRLGLAQRVGLRHALAEQLDYRQTFGLPNPFDAIFFSYSLSMMPAWPRAMDAALANLRPGGRIYMVDFWDQAGLPRPIAAALQRWLALFHVYFRPEVLARLRQLHEQGVCELQLDALAGRYAYMAVLTKR